MDIVKDFYENYYASIFSKSGLSSKFNSQTHRALETGMERKGNLPSDGEYSILEIGAGKGEHFEYVAKPWGKYVMLDILPQPKEFSKFKGASWVKADICGPGLEIGKFDRVISMCVFHHLDDPGSAMENIKKSLNSGGVFSLFLPSDPGVLNRIVRKLFVTPRARKLGFEHYELLNAREHRNHYWGLKKELEHQFRDFEISRKYYPFRIPAGNLSLFSIWHIKKIT